SSNQLGLDLHCGCQQASAPQDRHNLFFTSFWAFDPRSATQVDAGGTVITPLVDDIYAACTLYPDRAVAVSWQKLPGTTTMYHPDAAASHILAWTSDATTLDPTPQSITSAIQISNSAPAGPGDCAKILALLADVPLQIGNTMLPFTDHDGIYRDPAV